MKRKSNSKNRPSEFVKLFANILNYGLANHTHKRIIGVMNEKSNNAKNLDLEVNYEKCNSKINHCKNSRENQSNALQRDWTNQKFVSIRNDIIGKNKQRNACENPSMANSINAVGWIGVILLAISPLFSVVVWCSLAIFGLALLTVQATYNKVNNLIALNIISIITFSIKLIGITQ